MALTEFMVVQAGHGFEGSLISALDGPRTVLALVRRTALEDHFQVTGGGLSPEERNLLVDRNLPAFERIVAAKYGRGEASTLSRDGREYPFVEVLLDDIERSGEVLTDSVLAMARAARWQPA